MAKIQCTWLISPFAGVYSGNFFNIFRVIIYLYAVIRDVGWLWNFQVWKCIWTHFDTTRTKLFL